MGLSCDCGEWDGEEGWCYYDPEDFTVFAKNRRKRCSSCKELIGIGSECLQFDRERATRHRVEENIYGDTMPIAPLYMCSSCGEIYLNLHDVGYCLYPDEDMRKCMAEYHRMTGFVPVASIEDTGDKGYAKAI